MTIIELFASRLDGEKAKALENMKTHHNACPLKRLMILSVLKRIMN